MDDTISELNLDPHPIVEERESAEQIYKQKVFLRQLQPPTPQPVEIQIQEVLIPPGKPKAPLHVRVGQREPRTPSPIVIKATPPQAPAQSDGPTVYNKYIPPPKQPPQQVSSSFSSPFLLVVNVVFFLSLSIIFRSLFINFPIYHPNHVRHSHLLIVQGKFFF